MRPTRAIIDLGAIHYNLKQVRRHVGGTTSIMAVIKANAYGHGMIPVAQSILKHRLAEYFGVAIVEEGITLRKNNIRTPTLVFTAPNDDQLSEYVRYNLEPTLCSSKTARSLNRIAASRGKTVCVHIKVDTGMGRIGVSADDAVEFVEHVRRLKNIFVKGIYTHFAASDEPDVSFAEQQLESFRTLLQTIASRGIHIPLKHCANSGAILQLKNSYFDMVRPGIMMYGYYPSHETRKTLPLKPAMSVRSKIGFLKSVNKGTSISYGRKYFAPRRTFIASVAAGYADGISRRLTNKASALIGGQRFPIVGTICMDQLMIDLGPRSRHSVGHDVVLMGRDRNEEISAWEISDALETIPYEVCCAISERVPRVYINPKE
ncbi:MAG: alanine racemase [Bacteroidota bacterium]|nr:alanine racemase [Bacteroidota bacterium]